MAARIEAATAGSAWVPAIVAQKLRAELAETDADLLDGWLHAMAEHLLTAAITRTVHHDRALARTRAQSRAFGRAVADGDAEALSMFSIMHRVSEENLQRRAADMTGADHLFVASDYRTEARPLLLLAAFHEAVAKKVGKKRTADVFSEARYDALYRSITRVPEGAVA
jgi:hypothetical protein